MEVTMSDTLKKRAFILASDLLFATKGYAEGDETLALARKLGAFADAVRRETFEATRDACAAISDAVYDCNICDDPQEAMAAQRLANSIRVLTLDDVTKAGGK